MASVNRYRLLRRIATGGMAEVFEGLAVGDAGFERRVAIKQVLPHLAAHPSVLRMFLDEARLAAGLHHAGIAAVLDYGSLDGRPFQVLELIDGETAAELARRAPMPIEVALHVCREVARALHHAHRATGAGGRPLGIVHRDVNPTNIVVSWSGDVKLVDFGIAFALDRAEQTSDGATKGTLSFMSPEQLAGGGAASGIDARTDVFALGCTLHALIAGTSPIAGVGGLGRLIDGVPLELSDEVPRELQAIVARATAAAPDQRFASAQELADALGEALAARTAVDGRRQLESWLASVPREAPRRGQLDQMLLVGAEMVLVAEPRQIEREADPRRQPGAADSSGAAIEESRRFETRIAGHHPAPAVRRRWPWAVGLAAALGALGVLAGALAASGGPDPTINAEVVEARPRALPPPVHPPPTAATAPVTETAGVPVEPPRPAGSARPRPSRPRPSPRSRALGVVAVGGQRAVGGQLFVDGKRVGYAPKRLELSLGVHTISVVTADGEKIRRRIDVTERDTGVRPQRVRID